MRVNKIKYFTTTILIALVVFSSFAQESKRLYLKDRLHDITREKPVRVIPGVGTRTAPPSDAIILFDGTNLDAWKSGNFKIMDSSYMVAGKGGLSSKQEFGDMQMHVEWRVNDTLKPKGQKGSNSGIYIMGKFEVQVMSNFVNETYADGQAGAIYGQFPPLVNASTPQGNWNSYDIIFKAPVYENGKMKEKACITLLHNGVLVQNNQVYEGPTLYKKITAYPDNLPATGPIYLQYHNDPVEYRNIWVRETSEKKQTEKAVWTNPFPKDGMGTVYTTSEKENPEENKLFEVKDNSIEVLQKWVGEKAPFGIITSNKEYSSFNFELEYKWGERKFEPRAEVKRDAGILFHVQGEKKVWPTGLECQIQEDDTADLWVIKGPKVTVVEKNGDEKVLDTKEKRFQKNVKYANFEIEGWNAVRVEVRGSKSAKFYVNGHLVNEIKNFFDENGKPLTKGNICLQAEGAELTYRNVRIQEIK